MESICVKNPEDGSEDWYCGVIRHREDGPAVTRPMGSKHWYFKGKRHREDGPASEWYNGMKDWWFNGECLGRGDTGFWALWDRLTDEQRNNTNFLYHLPGAR